METLGLAEVRRPDREIDALLFCDKFSGYPCHGTCRAGGFLASLDHAAPGHALLGPGGVEFADGVVLDHQYQPCGQVAHIDHLQRIARAAGHGDLAALVESHRPISKASGGIVGADDVSRSHDVGPARKCLLNRLLAQRLEPAIIFEILAHRFHRRIGECCERRVFIAVFRIGFLVATDAGNIDVLLDPLGEQLCRRTNHARVVAGIVYHRIPLAGFQRLEAFGFVGIAIALTFFQIRKHARPRLAAIEQCNRMAARFGCGDDGWSQESGTAEDKNALGTGCRFCIQPEQ